MPGSDDWPIAAPLETSALSNSDRFRVDHEEVIILYRTIDKTKARVGQEQMVYENLRRVGPSPKAWERM